MNIELFIFYILAFTTLFFVLRYIGRFFSWIASWFNLNRRDNYRQWR